MKDSPTSSMSEKTDLMVDAVLRLYSGICSRPAGLIIKPTRTFETLQIEVTPSEYDYRKIIGKDGETFKAMQLILRTAAADIWITEGKPRPIRVELEVVKTGDGFEKVNVPPNLNYDFKKMLTLVSDVCGLLFKEFKITRSDSNRTTTVMITAVGADVSEELAMAVNKMFFVYGKATGRRIEVEFNHVHA